jgi:hypothetical protein
MVSEACPTNPRAEASGLDPGAVHRSMFPEVPEERLEAMLDVIREEVRRRAGLD